MVSATQLKELIASGETNSVDYKVTLDVSTPKGSTDFIKDIMAFGNRHEPDTAFIIIGVDNSRAICGPTTGLPDEATLQQLIRSNLDPPVPFFFYLCDVDGVTLGVIEIPKSQERFHSLLTDVKGVGTTPMLRKGQTCIRRGSSTDTISSADYRRLKSDLIREAYPQPDLFVSFGGGGLRIQTNRSGWPIPEHVRAAILAHRLPPGSQEPFWMRHIVPIRLCINCGGTTPAAEMIVDAVFPEECEVLMVENENGWTIDPNTGYVRRVRMCGSNLMHGFDVSPGVIYVRFLRKEKTYAINWAASASNMHRRTQGSLEVEIMGNGE